jgi:hypothetical protein
LPGGFIRFVGALSLFGSQPGPEEAHPVPIHLCLAAWLFEKLAR